MVNERDAIEPFEVAVADEVLADLFGRVRATRWPDDPLMTGWAYGVPQELLQRVAAYWADGYSWRASEARLNAYPQYVTTIDGARIHFQHARSQSPEATPLLLLHGWPGTSVEMLDIIPPLVDPSIDGADEADAFHVVSVSLPGYGFSGPTTEAGWDTERMARAVDALMTRIGYDRYVGHGTDWGSMVLRTIAEMDDHHLAAVHVSNIYTFAPTDQAVGPPESPEDQRVIDRRDLFYAAEAAYLALQATEPHTVAYALTDSPVGLLAWILQRFQQWTGAVDSPEETVSLDALLTIVSVFWLTNTVASAARVYYEDGRTRDWTREGHSSVPVAVAQFHHEPAGTLRKYAEVNHNIVRWTDFDCGGHFPGLEQPELLLADIREALRPYRS